MSCLDRLSPWTQQVSTAFAHLGKPQREGLALWSAGIALVGAAGITQISALLALVLNQQEQAVFQRLREWYLDAKHKSGKKRRDWEVTGCFAPLLCWINHRMQVSLFSLPGVPGRTVADPLMTALTALPGQ